jgi:hypothetical protein
MTRSRKRRYLLLIGAAIVVALTALIVGSFLSRSALKAQTATTASESSISQLEAVPPKSNTGPSAAPAESGGEPFKTCQICHPDFMQKPGTAGDLVFSHKTHLDKNVSCATCHPSPLGHFGRPAPMMTTCLSCHQGETAPNDCKNCHRKLDQIAPGLGKQVVHLDPDAKTRHTCAKCHDVNVWCEKCHGVAMPHPPAWPQIHGGYASADSAVCVKCHQSKDKTFCVRCHGLEMPHPAFWYSSHGDIAKNDRQFCSKCHKDSPAFCDNCHHAGFSPTAAWPKAQHAQVVGQQGTGPCFACHDEASCARCHPAGRYVR